MTYESAITIYIYIYIYGEWHECALAIECWPLSMMMIVWCLIMAFNFDIYYPVLHENMACNWQVCAFIQVNYDMWSIR